ncbi:MAG: cbb3-type cytochrome c oxidase subunit 3 [Paracoccaceae bacterium]
METYTILRAFADSWFLIAMTVFFVGVVLYTLRPGSRARHEEIAGIPLRHDDGPVEDEGHDDGR